MEKSLLLLHFILSAVCYLWYTQIYKVLYQEKKGKNLKDEIFHQLWPQKIC